MADQEQAQLRTVAVRDQMGMIDTGNAFSVAPRNMTELLEFSKVMSNSGVMVRPYFRGNVGACMAVSMQAFRWGFDPIAVSNKTYFTKNKAGEEQMAYEAQLVHAVILARAPLKNRPIPLYFGDGNDRRCQITAHVRGTNQEVTYDSPVISTITPKNSPLWISDPDQQLFYYSVRAFARRHFPDVIMGVYTDDEIDARENHWGADNALNVTPARPTRADYIDVLPTAPPTKTPAEIAAEHEASVRDGLALIEMAQSKDILTNLLQEMNEAIIQNNKIEAAYEAKFASFGVKTRGTSTAAETTAQAEQLATNPEANQSTGELPSDPPAGQGTLWSAPQEEKTEAETVGDTHLSFEVQPTDKPQTFADEIIKRFVACITEEELNKVININKDRIDSLKGGKFNAVWNDIVKSINDNRAQIKQGNE